MDQSKKTMRHFYCRDVLWETFEQMANDFDCSIDYLINEAMRYYARSKNYQSPSASSQQLPPQVIKEALASGGHPPARPTAASRTSLPPPPPQALERPGGTPVQVPSVERRQTTAMPSMPPPMDRQPASMAPGRQPAQSRSPGPPPAPAERPAPPDRSLSAQRAPAQQAAAPAGPPTLYLLYNNQRFPIDKDQFIIGRGSKTADLPIKDGNISRKHAAVIRRNGTYYIKDLGSTNGIDYKGMRIDNKRIDEGDIFHLCDYELRFTYLV